MDKLSPLLLPLPLLLLSSSLYLPPSAADDYNDFVYAGCTQPRYDPGSPYEYNVDSLLTSLANAASFTSYANFSSSAAADEAVSGLFQCRSDLPVSYCDSCVRSAISKLSSLCPSAAGAAVQLRACFLRYGNDSFLGKPDDTLLYKKCGAPGGNADLAGMSDAALVASAAPPSGGAYRVGGAGYVQAMSQCVGDLTAKECSECVSVAVAQLKAGCGDATAGEVYLGKCYARFWSNGVNSAAPGNANHGDGSGKTLAIIIGLMAGIALLIIFLSFFRRAGSGGKV